MNDFLRELAFNVEKVVKSKKVPDECVRRVMRMLHKTGVCKTENEFYIFAHSYLPSSFERLAFFDNHFEKDYYSFERR